MFFKLGPVFFFSSVHHPAWVNGRKKTVSPKLAVFRSIPRGKKSVEKNIYISLIVLAITGTRSQIVPSPTVFRHPVYPVAVSGRYYALWWRACGGQGASKSQNSQNIIKFFSNYSQNNPKIFPFLTHKFSAFLSPISFFFSIHLRN